MASKKKKRPTPPPPPVRSKPPRAASAPQGPTPKQLQREAQQAAAKRDALRRKLVAAGLAVAAIAAVAAYVVFDRRGDAELRDALTSGGCSVDDKADPTAPPGQNHVQRPGYEVEPPAGGNHLASVARSGVYRGQDVPPDGQLVHALEHGYVIAWHRPDISAEDRKALEDFEAEHDGDVLVVERPRLPVPVAATAWNNRLLCPSLDEQALERFFDEHVGNGPEDVPRG